MFLLYITYLKGKFIIITICSHFIKISQIGKWKKIVVLSHGAKCRKAVKPSCVCLQYVPGVPVLHLSCTLSTVQPSFVSKFLHCQAHVFKSLLFLMKGKKR